MEQDNVRDDSSEAASGGEGSSPNKISEDILKCLSSIFLRMSRQNNRKSQSGMFSSLIKLSPQENSEEIASQDPYGICKEYGNRDIGPYKNVCIIEANSIDGNRKINSLFLLQRLKYVF